ncbi:hypothetical protein K8T06_07070 [bacterium]|nr:hypothetical protein [bacterium]
MEKARKILIIVVVGLCCQHLVCSANSHASPLDQQVHMSTVYNIIDFGVQPSSGENCSVDIQAAIERIHNNGGGTLFLPSGYYVVNDSITVMSGVRVMGEIDAVQYCFDFYGTVITTTYGLGQIDGDPLFKLESSSSVSSMSVYYPEQIRGSVKIYPYTFKIHGGDCLIENITLYNSYQGIQTGRRNQEGFVRNSERHRIRNVSGTVIKSGIDVDFCTDIGRIENIHFHPMWWAFLPENLSPSPPIDPYEWVQGVMINNLTAFSFGWTDWEFIRDTFVWCADVGYHFRQSYRSESEEGRREMNGQLCGIACDKVRCGMKIDFLQKMGIVVTNAEIVANATDSEWETYGINISDTCEGNIRLSSCNFWGYQDHDIFSDSSSFVQISNCYFHNAYFGSSYPIIEAQNGKIQVSGCSFQTYEHHRHIELNNGIKHAIITGNNATDENSDGLRIINNIGGAAIIQNNEPHIEVHIP